jgi:hypothetical protein
MERLIIWGIFTVVVTAACFFKPRQMRAIVGGFFVAMGLGVHGGFILTDPQQYVTFARGALIPIYRDMAVAVVSVNPLAFGLAMLAFEVIVAAMILSRGRYAKLGLLAATLFLLGITPLSVDTLPNAILAGGIAYLLSRDYPNSVPTEIAAWLRARKRHGVVARRGGLIS